MNSEEQGKAGAGLTAVNEAITAYVKEIDKSLHRRMEKEVKYSDLFENKMLLIRVIRKGLPYDIFSRIKEITPFTEDEWAEYLNVSKKSLQRYRNDPDFYFKPIHTEKILELAEVTGFGKEVFDSTEQFYLWLKTPSYALGKMEPAELLKDSYGKELVMGELQRIEQGIFA